jgi:putative acetyltransferase
VKEGRAIRAARALDSAAIEALYATAFPQEDLRPLVRALSALGVLSLLAEQDGAVAGHVAFTRCAVAAADDALALLGPLAVMPGLHRTGIGGALLREGLERIRAQGVQQVLVLGDPAYYGRFGFAPERGVVPPYPLPAAWRDAWQSLRLAAGGTALSGTLLVPEPWQRPALWRP